MLRTGKEVPQRQHNEDRMRRARSWLERSKEAARKEKEVRTEIEETALGCERFIFLWIAFNAAYGDHLAKADTPERDKFNRFLGRVLERDDGDTILTILRETYRDSIENLVNNEFVYWRLWDWAREPNNNKDWRCWLDKDKKKFGGYLLYGGTRGALEIVFDRLYQLRNQVFHGGTTFAKGWGREQIRGGSSIMAALVPAILDIMQTDIDANPNSRSWGRVAYPRIRDDRE